MKKLILITAFVAGLSAQVFPSGIYTPLVAKDNIQTTLNVAMGAGDTTAFVTSTTGWVANMAAYICDVSSATRCTGTYEVMLVTAVPGSNALTVTRGFGGTSAIAHAAGKAVLNAPTAIYNKSVNDEVLAIETALGANLSNVTAAAPPVLSSAVYNFGAQTPGGSLVIGANVITMTPCPLGVSGTHTVVGNLPHLLYLSGGTGTAEAAPIAGGTCTSGLATGTLIISAANTHSGAWTIKSNTTGAQEAVYAAGASGRVQLACSTIDLWGNTATLAALTVPDGYSTSIRGCGGGRNTTIAAHFTTRDWIRYEYVSAGGSVDLGDFDMEPVSNTFPTSGASIRIRYRTYGAVSNVLMGFAYDGLVAEGSINVYEDLNIFAAHRGVTITCEGVLACQSQANLVNSSVFSSANNATGVYITDTTAGVIIDHSLLAAGGGILPTAGNTTALKVKGSAAGPFNEIMVMNGFLDGNTICADIEGNGGSYLNNSIQLLNMHIACSANGVIAKDYVQALRIQNSSIAAVGGTGAGTGSDRSITLLDNVKNVTILGNTMESDGDGCIVLGGTNATGYDIEANKCNGGVSAVTSTYALYAPVSVANLRVRDNNFSIFGTGAWLTSGGAGISATNNAGIDDAIPAVASASTLAFPLNPSFTVTGNTAVTTATVPFAAGAKYTFTATHANPGTWTAGATIGNTFTPLQNVPVRCNWDGTKVYCAPGAGAGYTPAGVVQPDVRTVYGKCTLGTNCAVTFVVPFTSMTSYYCAATDQTAAAAVKVVNTSASVATFTGTGTDVISFLCTGN